MVVVLVVLLFSKENDSGKCIFCLSEPIYRNEKRLRVVEDFSTFAKVDAKLVSTVTSKS